MTTIAKNPPKYHELCKALDAIPAKGRESDPSIPGITLREKATLVVLASFFGANGQIFPTLATIAEKLCIGTAEGVRKILPHISKEEFFEQKARRQTGRKLYDAIYYCHHSLEGALSDLPDESTYETYKGPVTVSLRKDLIAEWVKPWIDDALKGVEELNKPKVPVIDTGPDIPF